MTYQLGEFYAQCCIKTGDGSLVSASRLHGIYRYWCSRNFYNPLDDSSVLTMLAEQQHDRILHEGTPHYQGLILTGHYVIEYILDVESETLWDPEMLIDPLSAPFLP